MSNGTAFDFSAEWRCSAMSPLDGPHGWIVAQVVLVVAAAVALLSLRAIDVCRDRAAAPGTATSDDGAACTWFLDSVKLLCGQVLLGFITLAATIQLRSAADDAGYNSSDLCFWYLVGVLASTFVGMPLSYCGLRAVELAGMKLEDGVACFQNVDAVASCGAAISQSGRYGEPPGCLTWLTQIVTWLGVVAAANLMPIVLLGFAPMQRPAAKLVESLSESTYGAVEALMLGCVVLLVRALSSHPCPLFLTRLDPSGRRTCRFHFPKLFRRCANTRRMSCVPVRSQLTVAPLWMQYSFVRYQRSNYWSPFGPIASARGGGAKLSSRRRRRGHGSPESGGRQRLSSSDLAEAAVAAVGGEVWWDSPLPKHPPPPTPTAADGSGGLEEPFLLSTMSAAEEAAAAGVAAEGARESTGSDGSSVLGELRQSNHGHPLLPTTIGGEEGASSASMPMATPARTPRVVNVGVSGATPLQIQHIPARP